MKKLVSLFLFTILFAFSAHSQTIISGGIYSNTTWTKANSPYIITNNIVIFSGVALTIEPGVKINLMPEQP